MALVGYNKKIGYLTVAALGSAHNGHLLRKNKKAIAGKDLPDKIVNLDEEFLDILLVTIGISDFSRFPWLIKSLNSNTNDINESYITLKLVVPMS